MVKEVEDGKTLFVRHLRVGSTDIGYLYLVGVEVEGRDGRDDRESQKSPTRNAWHLLRPQLHGDIEDEVEEEVGDEDDEEGFGEIVGQKNNYCYQKIGDQKSDNKEKPEKRKQISKKPEKYLLIDLKGFLWFLITCCVSLGSQR